MIPYQGMITRQECLVKMQMALVLFVRSESLSCGTWAPSNQLQRDNS